MKFEIQKSIRRSLFKGAKGTRACCRWSETEFRRRNDEENVNHSDSEVEGNWFAGGTDNE